MMRCLLLLLLLPCCCAAQKISATDMKLLKLYSTGAFTQKHEGTDTPAVRLTLNIQPIWQKRKDGLWLFADKADTAHLYQVWHYYLQDDSTLVLQCFDFKDQQKALQLAKDIRQQSGLYIYHLFTSHGCDVYLKKDKTGFSGSTFGKECFSNIPAAEYLQMHIAVTKDGISWQQTSFDKDNKEVAALTGNYRYQKAAKPRK